MSTFETHDRKTARGFTMLELLLVVGIVVICTTLIVPAIHQAQNRARTSMCKNNLKMIGIALHNYHDTHLTFPPGWVVPHWEAGSGPSYSWQTMFLPFIDQAPLYNGIDFHNLDMKNELLKTELKILRCPSDPTPATNPLRSGLGTSNYSGNFGDLPAPRLAFGRRTVPWAGNAQTPQHTAGIFYANSSVRMRDIVDGTSNTIMTGERSVRSGAGIWPVVGDNTFESDAVTDTSIFNPPNGSKNSFSSLHRDRDRGTHVGFCDGSVHFISEKISTGKTVGQPGTWQLLGNRRDGMPIEEF